MESTQGTSNNSKRKQAKDKMNRLMSELINGANSLTDFSKKLYEDNFHHSISFGTSKKPESSSTNKKNLYMPENIDKWIVSNKITQTTRLQRLTEFTKILKANVIDLAKLRELSKSGIPHEVRGVVWQLLLGYLPVNKSEQTGALLEKRQKYWNLAKHLMPSAETLKNRSNPVWEQVHVDVIRTYPINLENFFESAAIRRTLCRIIYTYCTIHQNSNYWQGLNEIPTPFITTFFSFYSGYSVKKLNELSEEQIVNILESGTIESDVYWCVVKFVDYLQLKNGEYVVSKNGIITESAMMQRFASLATIFDEELTKNLNRKGIDFIHFAFRWMICLLIRELPITCILRLWDTYLCEADQLLEFHMFTSLSFLLTFSDKIKSLSAFDETMMFVQRIPTDNWEENHSNYLVSTAYQIKRIYEFYYASAVNFAAVILIAIISAVTLVTYQHSISQ